MRRRLYSILEGDARGSVARAANILLMALIVANVVAVIIESIAPLYARYGAWFYAFELISVAIFTIEYLLRIWVCVEGPAGRGWRARLRYVLTPMALIDLLAILPFYLGWLFELDTRFLRAVRLLRVFKLTRHSASMDLLLTVIRQELSTMVSAMFIMTIIIIVAASGIYLIEREVQPEAFDNIPKAMWWAAVTLTTVGYGDVVPVTPLGRLFGLFITIAGVGMVALPAGILASGFSLELNKRREAYRLQVRKALADGAMTQQEARDLEDSRSELGLREHDAPLMLESVRANKAARTCPHCGKPIG